MSYRALDTANGSNGGSIQLAKDAGARARNIHVTISNTDNAAAHAAYFGRSRRELAIPGALGIQSGIAVVVPNTTSTTFGLGIGVVSNAGIGGPAAVSTVTVIFQGWVGELWACADAPAKLQIEVMDSANIER